MQNFNLGFQKRKMINTREKEIREKEIRERKENQERAEKLLEQLEKTQFIYKPTYIPRGNILTKEELQKMDIPQNVPTSTTSGSTGIPTIIPKTRESIIWHIATNLRELQWRKWNMNNKNLKKVSIVAKNKENTIVGGHIHIRKLDTINNIQKYLENLQPHYIYTYPSIIEKIDLTKLNNVIDIKTCGEIGATSYSSEETGTIALQCPDNSELMHIMENIVVEVDENHGVLITDLTNPLINRYALTDHVVLGPKCPCGRTLTTIKYIHGRIRNMLMLPNGDKIWPTIGEPQFRTKISKKIERHQVVQSDYYTFEIRLKVTEKLNDEETTNLLNLVLKSLNQSYLTKDMFKILYVDEFPPGKFESFKSFKSP